MPRALLQLALFATVGALVYALLVALYVFDGVASFTGTCPPAPTDIPAYTCTAADFAERMIGGVWAMPAHVIVGGATVAGFVALGALVEVALQRLERRRARRP